MAGAGSSEIDRAGGRTILRETLSQAPWWLIILIIGIVFALLAMMRNEDYAKTFSYVLGGVGMSVFITVVAYMIALIVGLIAGLGRVSSNLVAYHSATLYVEVMRGLPMLVIILYTQFVIAPLIGAQRNPALSGIIALAVGYGAYLAEVYRAGIESIERGQAEAARSLGMSVGQTMRYIILPQALRRVLPPLGNDFIAMLKDSSLLSAIGVSELTQLAKIEGSRTFDYFRAFNSAAILYLILTLLLSLGVRLLERRTSSGRR
ncbi:MAG: amino acid ABC transporter permease [Chloroflexales bacterium]|nr:amino acid ABC transporter permease [Chloroflexales bacterium]